MFPHELVPDGMVFAAHHYNYLALVALVAAGTVWDDYRTREPLAVCGGLAVGLFAFLLMWPVPGYHALGALLALAGPVLAVAAVLNPRGAWTKPTSKGGYPWRTGAVIVVCALGALDDAVEHAFPVGSPLDWAFGILGVHGSFAAVVAFALLAVAFTGWDRLRRAVGAPPTGE